MNMSDLIVALISGAFTMIAIYVTIIYERKKDEKSNRLQITPYLTYKYIDYRNEDWKKENEDLDLTIAAKCNESEINKQFVRGYLVIKNIGLNSSIEINILQVEFDNLKIYPFKEINAIEVNNSGVIVISIVPPLIKELKEKEVNSMPIKILIGYSDLFDYYYEQTIDLYLVWTDIIPENYNFGCGITNISRPIFYKKKHIKYEKLKRRKEFNNQ